jgi:ribosomal protein S20
MKQTENFLNALRSGDYDKAKTELSSALEDLTKTYMQDIINTDTTKEIE